MVQIQKSSMINNIWKNFYDRLNSDVQGESVSVRGTSITLSNRPTASFPDQEIDTKSTYPLLVIETPSISTDRFTLSKTQVEGTITIEIYTNQGEAADKFMDKIIDSIETYKGDLADAGLHNIQIDSTDSDMVQRGEIKIHMRSVTFSFVFRYSKTRGY